MPPEPTPPQDAPKVPVAVNDWRRVRLWEIQPLRDLAVIALVVLVLHTGYLLRTVTVPLLLALGLAYLVEPVVYRLTRSGRVTRPFAAAAVIVAVALAIVVPVVVGGGFGLAQGARFADSFTRNVSQLNRSIKEPDNEALRAALPSSGWRSTRDFLVDLRKRHPELVATPEPAGEAPETPTVRAEPTSAERFVDLVYDWVQTNAPALQRWFTGSVVGSGADAFTAAVGILMSLFYLGFTLFLTLFFFFFICTAWGAVKSRLASLIPERSRDRVLDIFAKMDRVIAAFIRGRLTISAILCVLFSVGFWLIGVPAPIIVGVAVGVLSVVPYLALVGVPLAIALMWLNPSPIEWQTNWWWIVGAPAVLYWIVQATDDYIWTPMIQGKATGMDTPTILFAVLAGGSLAGFYGVMVAIPAAACIKILLKEVFWPRFEAWAKGLDRDFLPISRS